MKTKEIVLSEEQIKEWKAKFGHVYKVESGDDTIIYRPVKRSEYNQMMLDTDIDPEEEDDADKRIERLFKRQTGICCLAALYPAGEKMEALIENKAGLAQNLSEEIMAHSGFNALASEEL